MAMIFSLRKQTFQTHPKLFFMIILPRVPELEVEEETQVQEMTLDEWKTLQEQTRPKPEFNIRKPECTVPSKAVVIHKSRYRDDVSMTFYLELIFPDTLLEARWVFPLLFSKCNIGSWYSSFCLRVIEMMCA